MTNKVISIWIWPVIWTLLFVAEGASGSEKSYLSLYHEHEAIPYIQIYSSLSEIQKDLDKIHQQDERQLEKIESIPVNGNTKLLGIFRKGTGKDGIKLIATTSMPEFLDILRQQLKENANLTDFETYRNGNKRFFLGVLQGGGNKSDIKFVNALSWDEFLDVYKKNIKSGLRLIDLESYQDDGKSNLVGVYQKGQGPDFISPFDSYSAFISHFKEKYKEGLLLLNVESYQDKGKRYYVGVYGSGKPGEGVYLKKDNTLTEVWESKKYWENKGYGLVGLDVVESVPLPFSSLQFDVSPSRLGMALRSLPERHVIKKVGVIGMDRDHRCHIQGLSAGPDRIVTSCMTKGRGTKGKGYRGFLQIFRLGNGRDFTDYIDAKGGARRGAQLVSLYGPPHQHAVVGQAVFGKEIRDDDGTVLAARISMLLPVVNDEGEKSNPSVGGTCPSTPVIDLRDQDGNWIYSFCHKSHKDDKEGKNDNLSTSALFVQDNQLFLFAAFHEFLYIYHLDWLGPADPAKAHIEVESILKARVAVDFDVRDGGAGDTKWNAYDSLNLLTNQEGKVFLIGGRGASLDVWQIEFRPKAGEKPTLRKIVPTAKETLPGHKDMFAEGVSLQPLNSKRMRIWAAPWDYRQTRCSTWKRDRHCTHIWFFDEDL